MKLVEVIRKDDFDENQIYRNFHFFDRNSLNRMWSSKGKIVGTAKVVGGNTVQVEEREIETYGIGGKRVVEKRYYEAGTDNFLPGYEAQQKYKNKKIKNEGQSLPPFKSH